MDNLIVILIVRKFVSLKIACNDIDKRNIGGTMRPIRTVKSWPNKICECLIHLPLICKSGSNKIIRSSGCRLSVSFCIGTLGTRNFFGITPPHVFVRNACPPLANSVSDCDRSMQARFGGDCLLNDFFDKFEFSSRLRFLPGVVAPHFAYVMTDGRLDVLVFDVRMSRVDWESTFWLLPMRFNDGDDTENCPMGVDGTFDAIPRSTDGLSMQK